jgi:hypothetical protein
MRFSIRPNGQTLTLETHFERLHQRSIFWLALLMILSVVVVTSSSKVVGSIWVERRFVPSFPVLRERES